MKRSIKFILLVIMTWSGVCLANNYLSAQQDTELTIVEIREELAKRGIQEEDFLYELEKADLNVRNVQNWTTEELEKAEAILNRLEQKRNYTKRPTNVMDTVPGLDEFVEGPKVTMDSIPMASDSIPTTVDEVTEDLKKETPIFGIELLEPIQTPVFNNYGGNAPDSYILGAGDKLSITIFGESQNEGIYTIADDGYITVNSGFERVLLKGLSLKNAREKLYKKFREFARFTRGEFDVKLSYSRTVAINVLGEVKNPGTKRVSALNSPIHLIQLAGGLTESASLRNVKILKADGTMRLLDLYQFLLNPTIPITEYLEDKDVLFVPVQGNVVEIKGAVKKPMKYELLATEGINDLIAYARGLEATAITKAVNVSRWADGNPRLIDVDISQYRSEDSGFVLMNGDVVLVRSMQREIDNFIEVEGEISSPGRYERKPNMSFSDIISLIGVTSNTILNKVFLIRTTEGESEFRILNFSKNSPDRQLTVQDRDRLIFKSTQDFVDESYIDILGAVRAPGQYKYEVEGTVTLAEVLALGGGLRRDASTILVERNDPLLPDTREPFFFDVSEVESAAIVIKPFDRIQVFSSNEFREELTVEISGAVNREGEFPYGKGMSIGDLLQLAHGFKRAASTVGIEVSRLVVNDNQPTQTVIAQLDLDRNLKGDNENLDFRLEPYDHVYVRYINEFEMQKQVILKGELVKPGKYALLAENEKLSTLIERAGGISDEGFPAGARLFRSYDDIGFVVMKLDEVLANPKSRYNFILKDGDIITVPKKMELVKIKGATRMKMALQDEIVGQDTSITVAFHEGKKADFYINYYAGGFGENADKKLVFVEHPNGEIERSKWSLFGRKYPKVRKGSIITVGRKPPETLKDISKEDDVNWTKVFGDGVAQITSIVTLVLLINQLN